MGVGDVFVVAGQSNSANHGEKRQTTQTQRVAAFDGKAWRIANDPRTLSGEIPANTTATIVIPEAYRGSVRLDEQEVQPVDGALEIGGGRYELRCR